MSILGGVITGLLVEGVKGISREVADEIRERVEGSVSDRVKDRFDESLSKRITERAKEENNLELQTLGEHWDVIDDVDPYEGAFTSERDAVDYLVDEITRADAVDLSDESERELRTILGEEFENAVADFREELDGNEELQHRFQTDLISNIQQRLREIEEGFERLSPRRPYDLYDFPAERDLILETLLPGEQVPFVDRPEVPEEPEPGRHFVRGPSGSGKSRVIAERVKRLSDDAVEHVLIPEDRMLDPSDVEELGRETFDGDLLLVWEDVHRIDEHRENRVLEPALRELETALEKQGHELFTLLESRSGRLDDVPGNLPSDFDNEKSIWSSYQDLRMKDIGKAGLRELVDAMATEFGVELEERVQEALVNRATGSKSAPMYIKASLTTAENDRLTLADVDELPDEIRDIWERAYDDLQRENPEEWKVLVSLKYLDDLLIPPFSKLVRAVYTDLLDGDPARFRSAIDALQNRHQWLTVAGGEPVDLETIYTVHDTQLEAVPDQARDYAQRLSDLLLERSHDTIPEEGRITAHLSCGYSFYSWGKHLLAEEQFERAIELDPESAAARNNYAGLLKEMGEVEEAAEQCERALELDPDDAVARNNYAALLLGEMGEVEEAETQLKIALDLEPWHPGIHINYALFLDATGRPELARQHRNLVTFATRSLDELLEDE